MAAEHGFFFRTPGAAEWEARFGEPDAEAAWKEMTRPILELYTESTDGSSIEAKDSALVCVCDLHMALFARSQLHLASCCR